MLLDTHSFLWWITDDPRLSEIARDAITDADEQAIHVSTVSAWEMAIKASLGRLKLQTKVRSLFPDQLAQNRFTELPIQFQHVAMVQDLPFHHKDPFNRLLVCQALDAGLRLVSGDRLLDRYGIQRIW